MEIYAYIIIAIIIIAPIVFFRSPYGRGLKGEWLIRLVIKNKNNKIINNYIIEEYEGDSHQIDHLVLNHNGLFVIETKNISGRVYGEDSQKTWTQVLAYGKVKNKVYSPVRQNETHVVGLKEFLPKDLPIYSCVVFVQGNTKYIKSTCTFTPGALRRYILKGKFKTQISDEKIEEIYNLLLEHRANDRVSTRQHIKNIRTKKADVENNMCPRCHLPLVIREGKNGKFYGCPNFPDCKYTKNI